MRRLFCYFKSILLVLVLTSPLVAVANSKGPEDSAGSESNMEMGHSSSISMETKKPGTPPTLLAPTFRATTASGFNSDQFWGRETKFGFAKPTSIYEIKSFNAEFIQSLGVGSNIRFTGRQLIGSVEFQPRSDLNWGATLGQGEVLLIEMDEKRYDASRTLPLWKLRSTYTPIKGTDIKLEGSQDLTFMGWMDLDNQIQFMLGKSLFAEIDTTSIPDWQFRTNARWSTFGDSNQSKAFDHLILRDLLTGSFVFRAGIGGGWFGFREQMPGYWSPAYIESYGVRLIASKDFLKFWNIETRLNAGLHQEKNCSREPETSGELSLKYRDKAGWEAKLFASFVDSNSGAWWKNDMNVNLEMPL